MKTDAAQRPPEREKTNAEKSRKALTEALLSFAFILFLSLVYRLLAHRLSTADFAGVPNAKVLSLIFETLLLLPVFGSLYLVFQNLREQKPPSCRSAGAFPLWAVFFGARLAASLCSAAFQALFHAASSAMPDAGAFENGSTALLFFFETVLLAPAAEEFAYRAAVFSSLRRFGFPVAALCSTLLFAFAHPRAAMPYAFVFGLALAFAAETRGIYAAFLLHALNNLFTFALAWAASVLPEALIMPLARGYDAALLLCGGGSLLLLAVRAVRESAARRKKNNPSGKV